MNLDMHPGDAAFRDEVRTWLRANAPRERRPWDGPAMAEFDIAWQKAQFAGGWAGIAWPTEYGGRGLSTLRQLIWYEEYAHAEAPYLGINFVGINHGGPTLIVNATEAQKSAHLPPILRGDEIWCQGFSEPGSGSDLASLRTRGVIDGDRIIVNGSKIWTSWAQWAQQQELLIRTESGSQRHAGITWVICDMRSPGIEVRPIRTMAGGHDYCEVFYQDVEIPIRNVVGEIGGGWKIAMSTLAFERGTAFVVDQIELATQLEKLIGLARSRTDPRGRALIENDWVARTLGQLRAEIAGLRAMTLANISRNERTGVPGAEGSIVRLFLSQLVQRLHRVAMELLGDDALVLSAGDDGWTRPYLHSYAHSIGGGTAEIQRNIIAERILGLPRGR
jgi:alkylation response protein AidB-like acyl-CoA dehydrogenase